MLVSAALIMDHIFLVLVNLANAGNIFLVSIFFNNTFVKIDVSKVYSIFPRFFFVSGPPPPQKI